MTAVDPITIELTSAPISVTVASTGLVLSVATGTVGPAGAQGPAGATGATGATGAQGPAGATGATGATGAAGQGVPVGGTTGQALVKLSGTNYDTGWTTVSGGGGATAHGDLTGLTTGDDHPQYQRSESTFTTSSSFTITDETTVVSTGSTVVLPSAQAQAGRSVLIGAGADLTVQCAGTDVFLDGVGSTSFAIQSGNGVGFTSVDAGGAWGWAVVTRQGSSYDLPTWVGQSLAAGKVLRIDGAGAPAWANLVAADLPAATTSAQGALSAADKTKLDGLAAIASSGSATDLSGTVPTARLGTGTASANTFLRGDQTFQPVPVGNNDMGRVSNAIYLSGSGLSVNGATGNNTATTPDATALDITGDIEIVVRAALADWTLASSQVLVAKRQTASTRSYDLQVFSGVLYFRFSVSTGSDVIQASSTVVLPSGFSAGQAGWVRVTRNSTTGDVIFYTAADSSSEPSSWTQLGATVATTPSSMYSSNSQLEIGSHLNGAGVAIGTIYRAILRDVIGGTPVFDANFANATADALTFTPATGGTITITTTRYAYGIPNGQMASQTTFSASANTVYYAPFEVTAPITVDAMAYSIGVAQTAGGGNVRMGIYAADSNLQPTGAPLFDSGDAPFTTSTTGAVLKQSTPATLQPGVYLTAFNTSAAITQVRAPVGGIATLNTTLGASMFSHTLSVAQTQGAFPSPGTAWTARGTSGTGTVNLTVMRWRSA